MCDSMTRSEGELQKIRQDNRKRCEGCDLRGTSMCQGRNGATKPPAKVVDRGDLNLTGTTFGSTVSRQQLQAPNSQQA